nr:nuclear transport factor 2 family protein [Candidatus Rhodoblastus alkanivorans]
MSHGGSGRGRAVTQQDFSEFFPEDPHRSRHDLVLEVLTARADHARFIEFFHEDAIFTMAGHIYDHLFSGVFRGRENILGLLQKIDAEIETSDPRILNLIVDGDKIGLRRSLLVRHRGTAAAGRLVLGDFAILRDGKFAEVFEYVDTGWLKQLSGEDD